MTQTNVELMVAIGSTIIVFQRGIVFLAKILCRRHCPSLSLGSLGDCRVWQGCPGKAVPLLCFFSFFRGTPHLGFYPSRGLPLWWHLLLVDSSPLDSPSCGLSLSGLSFYNSLYRLPEVGSNWVASPCTGFPFCAGLPY